MTNKEEKKLTKKDVLSVYWRWIFSSQIDMNYENYQGMGYGFAVLPILRKLYKDDEEEIKKRALTYTQFYNSNTHTTQILLGIHCALEESGASEQEITNIKTSLMGPLAGIGDPLYGPLTRMIFGSIAAYMALEGNPWGCLLYFGVHTFYRLVLDRILILKAYEQGTKLVDSLGSAMNRIINVTSVVGLTVLGAMIPSVLKITTPLSFTTGDVVVELQTYFDKIMPSLLSVLFVAFLYWLQKKKNITPAKMIFLCMALGIVCSLIGIL